MRVVLPSTTFRGEGVRLARRARTPEFDFDRAREEGWHIQFFEHGRPPSRGGGWVLRPPRRPLTIPPHPDSFRPLSPPPAGRSGGSHALYRVPGPHFDALVGRPDRRGRL